MDRRAAWPATLRRASGGVGDCDFVQGRQLVFTGWIISARGPRIALLVGSGACVAAAVLASFVHTPANPDDALTDPAQ